MEIIQISGYTELEKEQIARRYLIPKSAEKNGLEAEQVDITEDGLKTIIRNYTRESGVRNLERTIDGVCRKLAVQVIKDGKDAVSQVKGDNLDRFLGVKKFKYGEQEQENLVGFCTGLAWTELGGELLVIEVAIAPGRGRLIITGKLGDVMQESAQAAMMYVRSRADFIGLPKDFYSKIDIHIHVPEGAIPKDGPSAGITMATAITSALTGVPVDRNIAMTGEITLRGRVLPIGGLKEKILAAHRGGINRVVIPKENEKDIEEIPTSVREGVEIITVDHVDEVLKESLVLEGESEFISVLESREDRFKTLFDVKVESSGDGGGDSRNEEEPAVVTH
jgi:ATP-dependent Lon protease